MKDAYEAILTSDGISAVSMGGGPVTGPTSRDTWSTQETAY